jgi:superfamily I DNA and/or RNA helicase
VILIGDHQQLRPQVNEYFLAKRHHLEVSMFERLINSGFPHVTLNTQRRMHPDISSLITPSIYKKLTNHPSVETHLPIKGIKERVFFIDHEYLEDSEQTNKDSKKNDDSDQSGRSNTHEARMILSIAQYLLFNGYNPDQIVILSMYRKQLRVMKKIANEISSGGIIKSNVSEIRMTTTDNYQGEECEVVLLSLVRSNKDGKAGFVKVANRICVALSRARNGLYVIGNFNMIRANSPLWDTICNAVEERGQFGREICLICSNHPNTSIINANKS